MAGMQVDRVKRLDHLEIVARVSLSFLAAAGMVIFLRLKWRERPNRQVEGYATLHLLRKGVEWSEIGEQLTASQHLGVGARKEHNCHHWNISSFRSVCRYQCRRLHFVDASASGIPGLAAFRCRARVSRRCICQSSRLAR